MGNPPHSPRSITCVPGDLFADLRRALGMRQLDLAQALGMSLPQISRLERELLPAHNLHRLALMGLLLERGAPLPWQKRHELLGRLNDCRLPDAPSMQILTG